MDLGGASDDVVLFCVDVEELPTMCCTTECKFRLKASGKSASFSWSVEMNLSLSAVVLPTWTRNSARARSPKPKLLSSSFATLDMTPNSRREAMDMFGRRRWGSGVEGKKRE